MLGKDKRDENVECPSLTEAEALDIQKTKRCNDDGQLRCM